MIRRQDENRRIILLRFDIMQRTIRNKKIEVLFATFGIAVFGGPITSEVKYLKRSISMVGT